ncbi:hypothetical protein [Pleomorphomonas koreensis]|uniref:hypothetical protein n=1 Tax=Pleomorphomonas koreensis TaxID=257440 RepID=UPI00040CFCB9|nr:hypothetical protein [Pleomorphomonas koreensis]
MALAKAAFTRVSTSVRDGAQSGLHFYSTADASAAIVTNGYFNGVRDKVKVGDLVLVTAGLGGVPATHVLRFVAVPATGDVTVAQAIVVA